MEFSIYTLKSKSYFTIYPNQVIILLNQNDRKDYFTLFIHMHIFCVEAVIKRKKKRGKKHSGVFAYMIDRS